MCESCRLKVSGDTSQLVREATVIDAISNNEDCDIDVTGYVISVPCGPCSHLDFSPTLTSTSKTGVTKIDGENRSNGWWRGGAHLPDFFIIIRL